VKLLADGPCPSCGKAMCVLRNPRHIARLPKLPKGTPKFGCSITVCVGCGGIAAYRDGGTVRQLTSDERRRLPNHHYAKQIREHQERIVARMWG
jgi:hypothetical protein